MNLLNEQELHRYHRQIMLFNENGQEKLKNSTVFIAGAGGLGCPIALYLAAAGIGTIIIVDNDTVEASNLNRQILHWEKDIGIDKTQSIEEKLKMVNPHINIKICNVTITEKNVIDLVNNANIIVDALDNFETRFLINEAAIKKNIPLIFGALRGFDGQLTTIIPGKTACLKCIFFQTPPKEIFPVIGVTAGIIGVLQANEVIKYLLVMGDLLTNKLLHWDGLSSTMQTFKIKKKNDCPLCGYK